MFTNYISELFEYCVRLDILLVWNVLLQAAVVELLSGIPNKQKTIGLNLYNVGPTIKTLGRRCINVLQMFFICIFVRSSILLAI